MKEQILSYLPARHPWRENLHWFDCVDSTNTLARSMASDGAPHGTVIVANRQTGGRGRLGRSFHSPAGTGIYMSVILRPACRPEALMHLTCAAAVAMCDVVEASAGFRPGIKWTNDLVYNRRKLGGILTELSLTPGTQEVASAVVGVGINVGQSEADFPGDIRDFAGSLSMMAGMGVSRSAVAAAMITAFSQMDLDEKQAMLARYREDCVTVGQDISLMRGDSVFHGRALDVDDTGALVVQFSDGSIRAVNSGEVSVRGMYGYL